MNSIFLMLIALLGGIMLGSCFRRQKSRQVLLEKKRIAKGGRENC